MKEFRKKANQGSFRKTFRKNPSQPWETIERATMAYTQQWCFRSNHQCMSVLVKAFPRLTRLCLPSDDSCTQASHATWRELYPFRSHIEMHLTTPAPQQRAQNRGPKIWSHHLLPPKLFFFFFLKKQCHSYFIVLCSTVLLRLIAKILFIPHFHWGRCCCHYSHHSGSAARYLSDLQCLCLVN